MLRRQRSHVREGAVLALQPLHPHPEGVAPSAPLGRLLPDHGLVARGLAGVSGPCPSHLFRLLGPGVLLPRCRRLVRSPPACLEISHRPSLREDIAARRRGRYCCCCSGGLAAEGARVLRHRGRVPLRRLLRLPRGPRLGRLAVAVGLQHVSAGLRHASGGRRPGSPLGGSAALSRPCGGPACDGRRCLLLDPGRARSGPGYRTNRGDYCGRCLGALCRAMEISHARCLKWNAWISEKMPILTCAEANPMPADLTDPSYASGPTSGRHQP